MTVTLNQNLNNALLTQKIDFIDFEKNKILISADELLKMNIKEFIFHLPARVLKSDNPIEFINGLNGSSQQKHLINKNLTKTSKEIGIQL